MANNGTIQDLDEWLLKLDNLQRALKSCSSSQPRRLQSPLVFPREQPVDGMLFRPMKNDEPLPTVHPYHPQTPPTISPQRRYPQPPVRKVFPSATEPPQRKFRPLTSPVHHYFPGEQFPMPSRNSNGNGLDEQNENHTQLQQNQQNSQHQPKLKTVRWSSEPATDRLQGIKKLVSDLDSVEADLVNAASENSLQVKIERRGFPRGLLSLWLMHLSEKSEVTVLTRVRVCPQNRNNRPSSPSDMPEIPPPPAFTNGNDHVDYNTFHEPDSNDVIPLRQQVPSPTMRHSPVSQYRSGSPATDRSSLQSQDTYNTLTRGRSPQPSDWIGNLHFWKSLQNREVVDSLNSRNQNDSEQDKKVVLRIHQPDRTTKAVYVQSRTDAGEVVLMLAAKNFLPLSTKMALVEKVPSMKLERCFEDDEVVRDCVLSWPVSNENLIFFEERQDLFGIFEDPQTWLGNTLVGDSAQMKNSLLIDILEKDGANRLPPFKDYLYILRPNNKWKRRYCVLRSSGLYASKKQGSGVRHFSKLSDKYPKGLNCPRTGGWKKDNTPTPYGFVLKLSLPICQLNIK
ncbi:hypothetical protein ACTXT7_002815 [Hymenolepis weldensis]